MVDADVDREAWGVDIIWGSTVYLVRPDDTIIASCTIDIESALAGLR